MHILRLNVHNYYNLCNVGMCVCMGDFYRAPANEVDVVYMGASSAGWSWNPAVAYHENDSIQTSSSFPSSSKAV